MELALSWYAFDSTTADPDLAARVEDGTGAGRQGGRIRCRGCEHLITHEGQRATVDGSHTHTRTNPAGYEYRFECYHQAPGCTVQGRATEEFSWFTGCRWQIAACGSCLEHLGWYFTGAGSFYCLIRDRIYSENP